MQEPCRNVMGGRRMKKTMILRTAKIWLAAVLTMVVTNALGLQFIYAAGLIAILSICPTKKETITVAKGRLLAFCVSFVMAYLCFTFIGYNLFAYCVFLLMDVLFCLRFKLENALSICAIVMSHFLSFGAINYESVRNAVLIFLIGTTFGLLANMHLHQNTKYMEQLRVDADEQIKIILRVIADKVLGTTTEQPHFNYFQKINYLLFTAKKTAKSNFMNNLSDSDTIDLEYISMRERQIQVLHRIYMNLMSLESSPEIAHLLSDFIQQIADEYSVGNDGEVALTRLESMEAVLKEKPLPATRQEFEDRAKLYIALRDMEQFLKIKQTFVKTH